MASGTGERPLGTIAQEKELMGLSGLTVPQLSEMDIKLYDFSLNGNTTYYLHFNATGVKYGLLMLDGANATKRGMYMYGAASNDSMHLTAVLASTQSGMTVTPSPAGVKGNRNYIKIENGAGVAFCMIISYAGVQVTVTTTEPT